MTTRIIIRGTSLVVQWLGLCASTAGSTGSIPGWGTRTPNASWSGKKKFTYVFFFLFWFDKVFPNPNKKIIQYELWIFTVYVLLPLFSSVQSISRVQLCDPMDCSRPDFPVHHQLPELVKLMSIKLVMPSNHLILCRPLLLLMLFLLQSLSTAKDKTKT